jgi:hypothetical protein
MAAGRPTLIRVFDPADGDWIRKLGGQPVLYSEAAAAEFLAWFTARAAVIAATEAGSAAAQAPPAGQDPPAAQAPPAARAPADPGG